MDVNYICEVMICIDFIVTGRFVLELAIKRFLLCFSAEISRA